MNKLKARIDAFNRLIVDAKAANVWDSIEAACIMAGWSNVAGALTPLKGVAPTNNGFVDADLDAGIGLKGDGSSKYIDSNRDASDDSQNDYHVCSYVSNPALGALYGAGAGNPGSTNGGVNPTTGNANARSRSSTSNSGTQVATNGAYIVSRSTGSEYDLRWGGETQTISQASQTTLAKNIWLFARNEATLEAYAPATSNFYSIGSSVDIAALDAVVSQLAADLRAIDEDGFDPLALDYIRRVEAADGAYLETGVKRAINDFIVGCRKDGLLDALKASCILCGARTISGALVPLVGPAPTAEGGWAAGDYDRSTGLKGDGSSLYLDSNWANNADGQDDKHLAVYATSIASAGNGGYIGAYTTSPTIVSQIIRSGSPLQVTASLNNAVGSTVALTAAGFIGASRLSTSFALRADGATTDSTSATTGSHSLNTHVFARNGDGTPNLHSDARLAFYSIGSSLDLSLLDNRVSTLISSISTALS